MQKFNTLLLFNCCEKKLTRTIPVILFLIIFLINVPESFGQSQSQVTFGVAVGGNSTTGSVSAGIPNCLPPICSISGSTSICPGTATTLCAPVGLAAYSWSNGSTAQCISVTQPGTYIVTVTAVGGCTSTCNITLTMATAPISGSSSICSGGSTQLCSVAGASSYSWSTGATTQCITVSTAGTYSVTTCINGCYIKQ